MITSDQISKLRKSKGVTAQDISSIRKRTRIEKEREANREEAARRYELNTTPKQKAINNFAAPMGIYDKDSVNRSVAAYRNNKALEATQKEPDYSSVTKKSDYTEKSTKAGDKPDFWQRNFKDTMFDWGQFDDDNINTIEYIKNTPSYIDLQYNSSSPNNVVDIYRDKAMAVYNMSDDDIGVYNYIFNTDGKAAADKYLDDYVKQFNAESMQKYSETIGKFGEEHPILGSLASVVAGVTKPAGLLYTLNQSIRGEEIDPNSSHFVGSATQSTLRNAARGDMGKVGGFFYDTGMSVLDSLTASTGGATLGALSLASGAGADAAKDVKERGGTDNQALLSALTSGAAEAVFERISLGNFKSLKDVPISGVKDIVFNTAKSMGVNASEEAFTEISNIISDYIIMGDISEYNNVYNSYLSQGLSEAEADKKAKYEMAKRIGTSALAGAVSGGAMSGVGQTSNYLTGSYDGSRVNKQGMTDTYIEAGKGMDQESDAYRIALEIETARQNNKKPSNYQVGNLARSVDYASNRNVASQVEKETTKVTDTPKTTSDNSIQAQATVETVQATNNANERVIDLESQNTKPIEKVVDIEAKWNDIEGAKVKGIERVDNGEVMVNIESSGETVTDSIENITFDNPAINEVYASLSDYQTNGAKAFISNYDSEVELSTYQKAFNAYYDAGLVNIPIDQVKSAYGAFIPQSVRLNAYSAGVNDVQKAAPQKVSKSVKTGGVMVTDASNKMDASTRDGLDALGKATGLNIRIEDTLAGGQANGYYKDGTLYIALDSENPYIVVAKHELTHAIQQYSPEAYKTYKDFVIKEINKSNPKAYNEMVDRLISRYAEIEQTITRDEAMDEIVADASEMFLTDPDTIQSLAEQDRTLAQKIVDFLKDFIEKIQSAITGLEPKSRAAIALNENLEAAKKAEELWVKALAEITTSKNTEAKSSNKFSLKDSDGRTLTEEQIEYFKDSKVRDEKGGLLTVYHGTNTDFTVFDNTFNKEGNGVFWLSKNKDYAEEMAIVRNGNRIIEAYVNIKNPLYVTLSTNQFSDYTAERPYIEQAILNGHDGVIFTNDTDNEVLQDTFYAAFESSQIKSVDNLKPTNDLDIRYQLKDVDPVEYNKALAENQKLREINSLLLEQFQLTKELKPNKKQLEKVSREILKSVDSTYDVDALTGNLQNIWKFINEHQELMFTEEVVEATTSMTRMILRKSESTDNSFVQNNKEMLDDIKKTPIILGAKDRADLASEGGYAHFRKKYLGKIKLVMENGIKVDEFYNEMVEKYPEFFTDDVTHPADQLIKIAEVVDFVKPIYYNQYGMNIDEAARDLAYDVISKAYFDIQQAPPTFADKKRNELLKAKYKYNQKVKELHNDYKAKYNERLESIRKENQKKIAEIQEKAKAGLTEKERKKYLEQIAKLKDDKLNKLKAQQDRFVERSKLARTRREYRLDTNKYKGRIKTIAKELSDMIIRPSDKKHIPKWLQGPVIKVLQILDFETGITAENGAPTEVSNRLRALQAAYSKLAQEEESDLGSFFDDDIAADLDELALTTDGRRINQLNNDELQKVFNILKHIKYIVRQENKMFNEKIRETVAEAGDKAISDIRFSSRFKQLSVVSNSRLLSNFADMMNKGLIKPYYFFKQIGGVMQSLYKNIRDGEDSYVNHISNAKEFSKTLMTKYNYNDWAKDKATEFSAKGGKINLTIGEKLYIYMAYRRDQGKGHILAGGVVPQNATVVQKKLTKGINVTFAEERADAVNFSETDMEKLKSTLTAEQIGFAEEMGEYISTVCADLGNEVSMKLFGYEKFKEKNYIPLNSSSNFLFTKAGVADDTRIKRAGFTKSLTPRANNPIIAADFMDVWAKHVNDMAMYNSFVLPIEDFTRVWNYKKMDKTTKETVSVKTVIQNTYGTRANQYIKKLLNDINGGIKADTSGSISKWLVSKMKTNAVMMNLSVALQQPTTIVRAMAVIDPKYFGKTIFEKRDYKELSKYSPQAVLKKLGYFDTNMGRNITDTIIEPVYDSPMDKIKAFFTDKDLRNDVFSWLPQKMDEIAWTHIWNAVKAETLAETKLQEGTAEYYEHCKERFKEVIDRSQVMDSVFQRSEMMRSTSEFASMATAFMSEPLVTYNMIRDAVIEYKRTGNKSYIKRTMAAVVGTTIFNSLLKSIIGAMRDRDEDKEFHEKYIENVIGNILDEPLSMIPIVNSVVSIFNGYDVIRPDMQLFTDSYYTFRKVLNDKYSVPQKIRFISETVAAWFSVPLKNVNRDIESIWRTGFDVLEGVGFIEPLPEYEKIKLKYDISNPSNSTASAAYYDLLYKTKEDGNTELYKQIYNDLIKSGRKPSNIETAMRDRKTRKLINRKKDEEYTHPLLVEAVDAYENKNTSTYQNARKKLVDEGFTLSEVDSAITSLKNERAKENTPTAEEFIEAYKTGDKNKWEPIFRKMRAAGWSQKDLLELVK